MSNPVLDYREILTSYTRTSLVVQRQYCRRFQLNVVYGCKRSAEGDDNDIVDVEGGLDVQEEGVDADIVHFFKVGIPGGDVLC